MDAWRGRSVERNENKEIYHNSDTLFRERCSTDTLQVGCCGCCSCSWGCGCCCRSCCYCCCRLVVSVTMQLYEQFYFLCFVTTWLIFLGFFGFWSCLGLLKVSFIACWRLVAVPTKSHRCVIFLHWHLLSSSPSSHLHFYLCYISTFSSFSSFHFTFLSHPLLVA